VSALSVFAHALHHLKNHALMELSDQTGSNVAVEDVRWVVTVPAIWKQPAKQFMREAAYQVKDCLCTQFSKSLLLFVNIACFNTICTTSTCYNTDFAYQV
jgi:hypothetical protein